MKKIFFAVVLLATSASTAFAQKAADAPRAGNEPRLELASKVNELEASLMRNRPEMTQNVLPQVAAMMQSRIVHNTEGAQAANGDAKTKLGANVKAEEMLYSAFKRLGADPVKNQKDLIGTARKFIEIY